MSTAKTIARNTGILFAADIFNHFFAFLLVVLITNALGTDGFGKYSFAFAFINVVAIFAHLGMRTYVFREIAKEPEQAKALVDNTLTIRMLATILVYGLSFGAIFFLPKAREVAGPIMLVMVHELFVVFSTLARTVFNAYEKNQYAMSSLVIEKVSSLVLGGLALLGGFGLHGLIVGLIAAQAIGAVYCYWILLRNFAAPSFGFDFRLWKRLLRNSLPFWLTVVFQKINYKIDVVMLGNLKDYATTGIYGAASSIVSTLTFIPGVIITASFPAMARFFHKKTGNLHLLYEKVFYYLLALGLPAAVGLSLLSDDIIMFLFQEKFAGAGAMLQILGWSVLFIFLSTASGHLLNAINKQHFFTIATGITAALNIVLNWVFIPRFGGIGAALATLIAQFFLFTKLFTFGAIHGFPLKLSRLALKPSIAALAMGAQLSYLPFGNLGLNIVIGALVYFAVLFLIGGIEKEEQGLVSGLFRRKKA